MTTLNFIVTEYLKDYTYSNLELYRQGCKDLSKRKVPDLHTNAPCYCYQHNEKFIATACLKGCKKEDFERKKALVVKSYEGEINENDLRDELVSHDVLLVEKRYLIDVGYGANCLRGAMLFQESEQAFEFFGETYRFRHHPDFVHYSEPTGDWWGLQILVNDRWLETWRFPRNCSLNDEEICQLNEDLVMSPKPVGIRDNFLLVAKLSMTTRSSVVGMKGTVPFFKEIQNGENNHIQEELHSWNAFKQCLQTRFNIEPDEFFLHQLSFSEPNQRNW
eukprot:CAMPEP_0206193378 /NCGR_PEP_ID=MMETSP0166-20121206/6527_1 /ASSEMBLY_ACC=CAM_ASM_000260 /TAXON_ID=95228 /ORGANISM="Vannella robusta, Strain DIVA3 518/3/11/1/6" /LENGTH=275 /DNA_ID=CAMNT_0053610071 /DNA_START=234 /DNA_END=1061 /DNA_ORIENTATION=-